MKGFTLVEMLISLAIFAVITSFVTANFNQARQGDELRFAAQLMASNIRRAQTAAAGGQTAYVCDGGPRDLLSCLGGQDAECGAGGICVREVPPAYGVHVSTSGGEARLVRFYADANDNRGWDAGEEIRSDGVSPGPFVSVSAAVLDASVPELDITFEPPKPTMLFNGASAPAIATITLRHSGSGQIKTVTVNRVSGQVSTD